MYGFGSSGSGGEKFGMSGRLTEARVFDQISRILSRVQGRITHSALKKILRIAEVLDTDRQYSREIDGLRKAVEGDHPYLRLFDLIGKKSPSCREKLFRNFFINAVFNGNRLREAFYRRYRICKPFFFVISPTMQCNLRCLGCYAGSYPRGGSLSRDLIDKILEDAKAMGIYFVTVSGGEPFCREDILDVFHTHEDVYFQVFTNGTLIDRNLAEEISRLGNVAPVISCEGLEKENDYRRGKGTFKKICDAMDSLREAGVIFGFSTVPAAYNYAVLQSDAYYDFLVRKGALFGWLFQYIPIGARPDPNVMLGPERRVALYNKVREVRNRHPLFIADFWNDGPYVDGCLAAGRTDRGYFHINSNGDIEPCVFVHFAVDNVHRIYERGGHLWNGLDSEFFRAIREGQPWNRNHHMPCMIIDNPHCLRNLIKKTSAYPTHEGAESLIRDPVLVGHLDRYSKDLTQLWSERDPSCRPEETVPFLPATRPQAPTTSCDPIP
jgi:MoaA/NifB/PqqE/SkfB family radical SAM enzyme